MTKEYDWSSLPNGFRDFREKDVLFFLKKYSAFMEVAKQIDAEIVVTPPVGFSKTFTHKLKTVGDKAYTFRDKKNRELILSPDSSPGILRWFLKNNDPKTPKRIFFISPVFRYRNRRDRFWFQFGFASFNGKDDLPILIRGYLSVLVNKLKLPTILQIGDLSIYRDVFLSVGKTLQEIDIILHSLRSRDLLDQLIYIDNLILDERTKTDLKSLLSFRSNSGDFLILLKKSDIVSDIIISGLNNLYELSLEILQDFDIQCEYVFNDFHGSEVQNGVVIKFKKPTSGHYADGGDYTYYGSKVEPLINSWVSFGGGLSGADDIMPLS